MEFRKAELSEYLECAKVVNIHGVNGALKLECRADSPEALCAIKTFYIKKDGKYVPLKVVSSSPHKGMVLCRVENVSTPEDAIKLKDTLFYAARGDFKLKKGDYFIADIIGLPVIDSESGGAIGTLCDVLSPAGRQVYVVRKPNGKTFMVPCVSEFIKKVSFGDDCDAGVYVKLIEGMDDEI